MELLSLQQFGKSTFNVSIETFLLPLWYLNQSKLPNRDCKYSIRRPVNLGKFSAFEIKKETKISRRDAAKLKIVRKLFKNWIET